MLSIDWEQQGVRGEMGWGTGTAASTSAADDDACERRGGAGE